MTSDMKKCPFCAEEILAEAKKCKHCQSSFDAPISEMVQKKVTVQGALTEKGRKTNLTKASKKWEGKGWTVTEAFDGGLTGASYLLLEIEKGKVPAKISVKGVLKGILTFLVSLVLLMIIIMIFSDPKQEVASKPAPTVSKAIMVDPNNINALDVDISKNAFLPSIAEIYIKKDENYYTVVIDKTSLKKGFEWKNNDNKWGSYDSWQVKAFAYFNGDNYILAPVPECNGKCYVTLKIIEFDEAHKRAVINISAKLLNETKYIASKHLEKKNVEIIGFDNLEIEIINTNKKPYFNNLIYMESNKPQEDEELNLVLTDSIKEDFNTLEKILLHIKKKAQELEEVTSTQPMGRGESGSLYLAKWNGSAQRWARKAEAKISSSKLNELNYCFDSILKMKVAVGNFPLVGIGYIGQSNKQKENVLIDTFHHSLSNAQLELAKCKARFNQ